MISNGFGNRTTGLLVDAATNRISTGGYTYDANGNLTAMPSFLTGLTYDMENRMTQATHTLNGTEQYGYSPDNKRVWKKRPDGSEEIYFYGVDGRKLGSYQPSYPQFTLISKNVYFGGKLIQAQGGAVMVDRLGSVRVGPPGGLTNSRYYEYGEEQSATQNDREKFGTYFRDGTTALDYADQRYYASTLGRFFIADDSGLSESVADPHSWNRYAYVENDPINYNDPEGLLKCTEAPNRISESTFGSEILANDDRGLLGRVVWAESDNGADNGFQTQDYFDEKAAVAVSIVNRVDILNYKILISGFSNPADLGWGPVNASLTDVLSKAGQYASVSGNDINAAFKSQLA